MFDIPRKSALISFTPNGARAGRRGRNWTPEREAATFYSFLLTLGRQPARLLADVTSAALHLCDAGSAGICTLSTKSTEDDSLDRGCKAAWLYAEGALAMMSPIGATVLMHDDVWRTCLSRNEPVLFVRPGACFTGNISAASPIVEMLAVPVVDGNGHALGLLWAASHEETARGFDADDASLLERLANVATLALRDVSDADGGRMSMGQRDTASVHLSGTTLIWGADAIDGEETATPPRYKHQPHHSLTSREAQVLASLLQGRSNKVIAKLLGLSQNTVKVHITHIMRKLQARNRTELALMAERRSHHPAPQHPRNWQEGALRSDDLPNENADRAL